MRDDFHKLTIVFFRIHEQFFQLDHYKWPGNGSLKKLEYIFSNLNRTGKLNVDTFCFFRVVSTK